jgi:parallel beta-helix repeat protein
MKRFGLFLLFVALSNLVFSSLAQAKDINVPADFKTIGEALTNASAGDVIKVAAGTYAENLNIAVSVTLEGAGAAQTIIDGTSGRAQQQPVILIRNISNVTIRGFTIQNGRRGISTERATGLLIENNIIKQNLRQGVLFNTKSEGKILNNEISENLVDTDRALGRGINITDSQAVIAGNTIAKNAQAGIAVFFSKVEVSNNQINENGLWGVFLSHNPETFDASEGTVTGNTIRGNLGIGLFLVGSVNFTVSKNVINSTQASSTPDTGNGEGIFMQEGATATINENTITSNQSHGVVVGGSAKGELNSNIIKENKGCGVAGANDANVTGSNNELSNNAGGDVCGSAPASIKKG